MKLKSVLVLGAIVAVSACRGEKETAPTKLSVTKPAPAPVEVSTDVVPVPPAKVTASKSVVDASAKILDASQFDDPRAKIAYTHAKEIPDRLSRLHCYCECDTNPQLRHTSLLSCYQDDHAAECGICQSEEEQAYRDWKAGRPVEDTIKTVTMMYGDTAMHM